MRRDEKDARRGVMSQSPSLVSLSHTQVSSLYSVCVVCVSDINLAQS